VKKVKIEHFLDNFHDYIINKSVKNYLNPYKAKKENKAKKEKASQLGRLVGQEYYFFCLLISLTTRMSSPRENSFSFPQEARFS